MILAAGLTPAWQQILLFDAFCAGEVNRAREALWCASGKVLNVGIALGHLGGASKTLCLVGGSTGNMIRQEFQAASFPARWVESRTPTRVCTTLLDKQASQTTELVENSAPVSPDELSEFCAAYAEEAKNATVVVLSGSLPNGTPPTFYRELLKSTPCQAVLDIRGAELREALECRPFLVKPNREELGRTVGRPLSDDAALVAAMKQLNETGAEWVVISQGRNSVFVTSKEVTAQLQPPEGPVVNPIGCGDSMAAGIAWALDQKMNVLDAVRFGMAAASDNLSQLLPARLNLERVRQIADGIRVAQH